MEELHRVRSSLAEVARRSRDLPWGKERPWRPETHVGVEGGIVVVDLHDLSVRLGVMATEQVLDTELDGGAVVFITGRGRHSVGPSRLRQAVLDRLLEQAGERGWQVRPQGPGRVLVVTDPERAPATAAGRLPALFWLVVLLLGGAVVVVLGRALGLW